MNTLKELIDSCRRALDDTEAAVDADRYWKDVDLTEYLNDAQEELVKRTRCLVESLDDDLCLIQLVSGQRNYPISSLIIDIDGVQPSWTDYPLIDAKSWHFFPVGWLRSEGTPSAYCLDYSSDMLTFDRAITLVTNESVRLTVRRMPKLMTTTQGPEIKYEYRRKLLHHVLARAFSKQDSEIYNPSKAANELALWNAAVADVTSQEARLKPRVMRVRRPEM